MAERWKDVEARARWRPPRNCSLLSVYLAYIYLPTTYYLLHVVMLGDTTLLKYQY